jgi:hypothetical protein
VVSNQEVYEAYRIPLSQGNRCTEDDHFGRRYMGDSNRRSDSGTIHSVHSTWLPGVVVGLAMFYAARIDRVGDSFRNTPIGGAPTG